MQPQQDQNFWQPAAGGATPQQATPQFSEPEPPQEAPTPVATTIAPITWQASEFIHHEKNATWFLAVLAVGCLLLILDALLIKSWTFGALIVVMAMAAIVVARRPPRTLTYTLSTDGIRIDEKYFSFHDFRAFGIVQEGAFHSVRLIPNKRFMPMVSVYFPTEQGEQIVDILGAAMPMEQIELDPIDKFVEKIRF